MAISIRDFLSDGYKGDQGPIGYTGSAGSSDADTLDGQHGSYYTGYADTAIANLIDTAPTTLDTLNELAAALGDDPNFATTVTNSIAGKVSKSGDTMTGDLSFGDNVKATFGAESDLQIFALSGNSYISEGGAGSLSIRAADLLLRSPTDENYVVASNNGAVTLYYDNAAKLATTSTGVDVTGTVTADGLTVDASGDIRLQFSYSRVADADNGGGWAGGYNSYVDGATVKHDSTGTLSAIHYNSSGVNVFTGESAVSGTAAKRRALFASNGDISFYEDTGTTPKFFWDASAEALGIGTASPYSLNGSNLEVYDASGVIARLSLHTSTGRHWAIGSVAADSALSFYDVDFSTERMRIDASGNVGIGTSSPASGLHINQTTGGGAIFSQSGYNYATVSTIISSADALFGGGVIAGSVAGQVTKTTGDAANYIRAQISEGIAFHTNITGAAGTSVARTTNERMRISSSGNLLVGTTVADNAQLKVRKTITTGDVLRLHNDGAGTGVAFVSFRYGAGQSEVGWIGTNGTTTSYNTSSDYRLKENVVPLAGAANRLAQIPVHRFNFIADRNRTVDGFLAHEVQAIVPEAVTGEKDAVEAIGNITDAEGTVVQENVIEPEELAEGQTWTKTEDRPVYQGIDQSKLTPLLTAALQEALQKIEALEARVTALETQP